MHPGRAVKRAVTPKAVKGRAGRCAPSTTPCTPCSVRQQPRSAQAASARLLFSDMEIVRSTIELLQLQPSAGIHSRLPFSMIEPSSSAADHSVRRGYHVLVRRGGCGGQRRSRGDVSRNCAARFRGNALQAACLSLRLFPLRKHISAPETATRIHRTAVIIPGKSSASAAMSASPGPTRRVHTSEYRSRAFMDPWDAGAPAHAGLSRTSGPACHSRDTIVIPVARSVQNSIRRPAGPSAMSGFTSHIPRSASGS